MKYLIIISTLFLFVSCLKEYDTTNPDGYPYDINIQELKIIEYSSDKFIRTNAIIESYESCMSYKIRYNDTINCPCKNFDFNKNVMFLEYHYLYNTYSASFFAKGYINHKNKTYGVNVSKKYKVANNSGMNSSYQTFIYSSYIKLPKFEGFKPVLDVEF